MPNGFYFFPQYIGASVLFDIGYLMTDLDINVLPNGRQWLRPGDNADILAYAAYTNGIGNQRRVYGKLKSVWDLRNLSPEMALYIKETFFTSLQYDSPPDNFRQSTPCTFNTFNRATGNWETYQAMARYPQLFEQAEPVAGGYDNFIIEFEELSTAPATSIDFQLNVIRLVNSLSITWENQGDNETLNKDFLISATVQVPRTKAYLSSITTIYDIEYSENNGQSYSPTYSSLNAVTHFRLSSDKRITSTTDFGFACDFTVHTLGTQSISMTLTYGNRVVTESYTWT